MAVVQTIQELIDVAKNTVGVDQAELAELSALVGKVKELVLRGAIEDMIKIATKESKEIDHIAAVMARIMIPAVMGDDDGSGTIPVLVPAVTFGNRMTDLQVITNQLVTELNAYNESANTAITLNYAANMIAVLSLKTRKNPDQIERSWSELASAMSARKITHVYILDNKNAVKGAKAVRVKVLWQSTASQSIELKVSGAWHSPTAAGKLLTTWPSFNAWPNMFVLDSEGNPTISVEDFLTEYRKNAAIVKAESAPTA